MPFIDEGHYCCDWIYPRSPSCTVTLAVPAPSSLDEVSVRRHLFHRGSLFTRRGWTLGTGDRKGMAYCPIHADDLKPKPRRTRVKEAIENLASSLSAPSVVQESHPAPSVAPLTAQGAARPSWSPKLLPPGPQARQESKSLS